MLTINQKEAILRRAGVSVPERPPGALDASPRERESRITGPAKNDQAAPPTPRPASEQWTRMIETLYVEYVARRAAKSLRDAEEARQLGALRHGGEQSRA